MTKYNIFFISITIPISFQTHQMPWVGSFGKASLVHLKKLFKIFRHIKSCGTCIKH
jgi:hypothetical protein